MSPRGAIVLCGGLSSRMGTPKALLPFHGETMLERVTRVVSGVVDATCVVAAESQALPALAAEIRIVRDRRPEQGPLEGLAAGLAELARWRPDVEYVLATGCDAALLSPTVIELLFGAAAGREAAIARFGEQPHPLPAVYLRRTAHDATEALLARGARRLRDLAAALDVHWLGDDALGEVDPDRRSWWAVNTPEQYARALAAAR